MTENAVAVAEPVKKPVLLDLHTLFAIDKDRAKHGATMKLAGTNFKIARLKSAGYVSARLKLGVDTDAKFQGDFNEEERENFFNEGHRRILAEFVLVDWDVVKYKGEELAYSRELAYELLGHDDFADLVVDFANSKSNYLLVTEDEEKN